MEFFLPSFLAGVLTILAPCVLSVLPIIIGGSVGEKNPLRPLIIVGSLSVSVIFFTILLKGTTALIAIPQNFWAYISGGLITFFGLSLLFPETWSKLVCKLKLNRCEAPLTKNAEKSGLKGAILLGASLGPVFTTCSPTYALLLAIVLPKSFSLAFSNLLIYALGMSLPLLAIGYGGQRITAKFRAATNPKGWFKKGLAIVLILTGVAIFTGVDKKIEAKLIEKGYVGGLGFEKSLIKDLSETNTPIKKQIKPKNQQMESKSVEKRGLKKYDLQTNTAKVVDGFDISKIVSGGPGKDGIPAINNPVFSPLEKVTASNPNLKGDHRGILLNYQGETRFYPYNILVWHEIVNDVIGDKKIAVTFCPLCGSAIVYERELDGETVEFRVSGLLYESNLLMYDTTTESLWSQIEGRSVVGEKAGTELRRFPMQLITFAEAKKKYPDLKILSEKTGYSRRYDLYPYGDYDTNDDLYFNVSYTGGEYKIPIKEIVFATIYKDTPIAFVLSQLRKTETAKVKLEDGTEVTATYKDGEATVTTSDGEELVGYFAQWFSWANHNLEKGVRGNLKGVVWNNTNEQ